VENNVQKESQKAAVDKRSKNGDGARGTKGMWGRERKDPKFTEFLI